MKKYTGYRWHYEPHQMYGMINGWARYYIGTPKTSFTTDSYQTFEALIKDKKTRQKLKYVYYLSVLVDYPELTPLTIYNKSEENEKQTFLEAKRFLRRTFKDELGVTGFVRMNWERRKMDRELPKAQQTVKKRL